MKLNTTTLVFVLAIFAVGAAAPLARLAEPMHPIALGFGRTLLVGIGMLFWAGYPKLSSKNWQITLVSSLCLAGHFWAWFASLEETTVLRSTVLVCLNPLWVGIWEWFLSRKFEKNFWFGTLIAVGGAMLMSLGGHDSTSESHSLFGDALAIFAGILGAVYLIITRHIRQAVSVHAYSAVLSLLTAFVLFVLGVSQDIDMIDELSLAPWIVLAMALGPQLFGHVGLTWCLETLKASTVALGLLLEPVGAAILAWWWFSERPTAAKFIGSLIILCGLVITQRKASKDISTE